jgi:hypothetical protein
MVVSRRLLRRSGLRLRVLSLDSRTWAVSVSARHSFTGETSRRRSERQVQNVVQQGG